jgi:transglutaminase-like putative cysteine protease
VTTHVTAALNLTVFQPARMAVQIAVSDLYADQRKETVEISRDGVALDYAELGAPGGGRIWALDVSPGPIRIRYAASVASAQQAPIPTVDAMENFLYLRPSRYCESDRLASIAARHFAELETPAEIVAAVSIWVGQQLYYVIGSSGPTDAAVDTLLKGRGVCRDYAHLTIALLRALDVPARLSAVFAPGLWPMDFHAVAEAFVDGAWNIVDSSRLAPRSTMLRIGTGRDAADTSFLSTYGGGVNLDFLEVTAVVEGELPSDDFTQQLQLR